MIRRRPHPVSPPVTTDSTRRADLAAALLFTVTPTDRALAGWCASEWAVIELEHLGIISATSEGAA